MTIAFTLNHQKVKIQAPPDTRLIDLLRERFSLREAKAGCLTGGCGTCSVIFNRRVAKACLIPAFLVQNSTVITLEGFTHTDAYKDIIQGFASAGVESCGYCDSGKILTMEAILAKDPRPSSRKDILAELRGLRCRCTEPESLVAAFLTIADIRQRRLYGRRP
ncbi:MAG: 2Fe-2S iron-sulfur cluster binding domain-containing protein [Spirochaetaceae bacterium]|jgi:carbon-monoxide dehydrogenase small subunit|nr:2Fe-2S iron-sulfur cluster binding domain-containing protein [Spirochaetaceae bacterium]